MNLNATILGQMISFILFVIFCMQYIWPEIILVIENRKKKIIKGLQELKNAKEEIKILKLQAKKIICIAKEKSKEILNQANRKKIIFLEEAIKTAKKEKKRIILQANSEIKIQKNKIRKELMKEINHLAIIITKKIIHKNIDNNKNIIESFINYL
ncbi:F0F1 ATP synthase subunit B [Buchnera aphidicola]|uniref:F0F1 ATP synthase subunit B n=1 Tax=Buchnera aphidicola TaxID=9 RepID=UPI0034648764